MRKTITLLFFLFITLVAYAQDIQPGQQAQNLTEHKNVMVDYSTGLFHYTVPLYQLKSGNYELPVSLDYVSRGVKNSESPGMLGYTWTLNTGGIVTRTVRGGFADEESSYGYLWTANGSTPLENDCKNVSLRKRDGESDIFTAVFNGKSVSFIVRVDENLKMYAEPLEHTNVRIECEGIARYINGWSITDENGDCYIYRQTELSKNVNLIDISTSNAILGGGYISSWYLTKIIPYGGAPIEFFYKKDVRQSYGQDADVHKIKVWDSYEIRYSYGKPVKEYPFDFSKYQNEFQSYIQEARFYLARYSWELRSFDAQVDALNKYGLWASQPLSATLGQSISENFRIIGLLGEIKEAAVASERLVKELRNLAKYYADMDSSNLGMASTFLNAAANVVVGSMREVRDIRSKTLNGGVDYDIYSPLLAMIVTPDRIVEFKYQNEREVNLLKSVTLCDWFKQPISSVSLAYQGQSNLFEVSFCDQGGIEMSNILLYYYDYSFFTPLEDGITSDLWGYSKERLATAGSADSRKLLASLKSLKSIILSDGGKIEIGYEKNEVYRYLERYDDYYGGIRLKSLVFTDGASNEMDTISYNYPLSGRSVYDSSTNSIVVRYPNFSDVIFYERIRNEGHPFLNFGNNGIYYPYVTETIRGKGTNAYFYQVPMSSKLNGVYAFWLNGLLLGKAMYDEQGNLKQMIKYKYGTAIDKYAYVYLNDNRDYFINDERLPYNRFFKQMQASDYYLDEEELKPFYERQSNDYIYGEDLYDFNIKPRLSPMLPRMSYNLYYGGRTMLKEELEYRFEGNKTDKASYDDFFMPLEENPYCKIEYHYDNIHSTFPTRIDKAGADGNIHTTVCKRVADIGDGIDLVIDQMKQKNLLSPVVKQLNLFNGQILNESVWSYRASQQPDTCFAPFEQFVYIPDSAVVYSESSENTSLFTYGESNYEKNASYKYSRSRTAYLPTEVDVRIEKKSYAYDAYGHLLLDCNGLGASAIDRYKGKTGKAGTAENWSRPLKDFYDLYKQIDPSTINQEFAYYFYGSESNNIITRFIEETIQASVYSDLELIKFLQAEIVADNYRLLSEFEQQYKAFVETYPQYRPLMSLMEPLRHHILSSNFTEIPLANYMYQAKYETDSPYNVAKSIYSTTLPDSKRLKLYVLHGGNDASCQVTHAGGKTNYTLSKSLASDGSSILKVFDIDLSTYQNVTAIEVPSSGTYMALVPEGASFEATSYNSDGTVDAKFDQSGSLELYAYDSGGRLIQTKDQYYNILKEYEYNQVINQ